MPSIQTRGGMGPYPGVWFALTFPGKKDPLRPPRLKDKDGLLVYSLHPRGSVKGGRGEDSSRVM